MFHAKSIIDITLSRNLLKSNFVKHTFSSTDHINKKAKSDSIIKHKTPVICGSRLFFFKDLCWSPEKIIWGYNTVDTQKSLKKEKHY